MSDRPDGSDINEYRGFEKWSNKRWAWEFLRRNDDFLKACLACGERPTKAVGVEIAARFGLTRFKHATEAYRGGERKRLKTLFVPSTVQYQARLQEQDKAPYRRQLEVGDLVIRMNLHAATDKSASLASQLRVVEKVAREQAKAYARAHHREPVDTRVERDVRVLLGYVRLLDGRAAKMPLADCAKMAFPQLANKSTPPLTNEDWRDAVKSRWTNARDYAKRDYLKLAVAPLTA
jgi:hypothetical protein